MTDSRPSQLAQSDLPLPIRHLQLYSQLRDGLALLAFGFSAVSVITAHFDSLTWLKRYCTFLQFPVVTGPSRDLD